MEKFEQTKQPNIEHLKTMASELDELQKQENNGRGVSCVRSAVAYLKMGNLEDARTICFTDHDKIINYPKLVEFIKNNLFDKEKEHPWSVLERLQQHD